jgi:hypothetical protein
MKLGGGRKCNSWKDQNLCEKTGLVASFYLVYSFHPDFWFRPHFFDTLPPNSNVSLKKKVFHWVVRVFLYMVFWVEYSLLSTMSFGNYVYTTKKDQKLVPWKSYNLMFSFESPSSDSFH